MIDIVIPIKIDSVDRVKNVNFVIDYLNDNLDFLSIIVVEQDSTQKLLDVAHKKNVTYIFQKNEHNFSKALAINTALRVRKNKIVCVHDADVLLKPEAYLLAIDVVKKGKFKVVLPYNQIVINIKDGLKLKVLQEKNIGFLGSIKTVSELSPTSEFDIKLLNGGVVLFDGDDIEMEGGFNERMKGYGWEDTEFHMRMNKVRAYMLMLREFSLVHLDHERGKDSQPGDMFEVNRNEYFFVKGMSRREVYRYIENYLHKTTDRFSKREICQARKLRFINDIKNILFLRRFVNKIFVNIQIRSVFMIIKRMTG